MGPGGDGVTGLEGPGWVGVPGRWGRVGQGGGGAAGGVVQGGGGGGRGLIGGETRWAGCGALLVGTFVQPKMGYVCVEYRSCSSPPSTEKIGQKWGGELQKIHMSWRKMQNAVENKYNNHIDITLFRCLSYL